MISWLVLILLGGFVVHLERRIGKLERQLAGQLPEPSREPEPKVVEEPAAPVEAGQSPPLPEPLLAREPVILKAEPLPEPAVADHAAPEPSGELEEELSPGFGFEELFGRRLPIWAGGITLAVAGMLIVKLSIEAGLLSPPVRVIAGSIFGAALIAAAELALRQEKRIRDARVCQALAGAGIASLYASILIAANLYQLVGPFMALLGMAAVTVLALGLSLRFGAPSALLGLAGGLAAPALIGSESPNIPLLALYLALAVAGLCAVSRGQRWAWLGISALVGGFGWGLMLLLGGAIDTPDTISIALYLLLLGVAVPMLGFAGDWQERLQLVAAIAAAAQMAALVATGGFALLNWAVFGMISIAMLWLAEREPALRRLPPVGLMITLLLLGAWPDPRLDHFSLVMGLAVAIYGGPALRSLWRRDGGLIEAAELAAIALGGWLIPMLHFYRNDGTTDVGFGLLALGLSAAAGGSAALGWSSPERRDDARFAILATSSAFLLAAAATLLLPGWSVGPAIAGIGLGLLQIGQQAEDQRLEPIAWIFAGVGLIACLIAELTEIPTTLTDSLRWGLLAVVFAAFAWRARIAYGRNTAQFLAAALLYLTLTPIVPDRYEPLIAPLLLVALASVRFRLFPAMAAAGLILASWALEPMGQWAVAAVLSVAGFPMYVGAVPPVDDALLQLLIPATLFSLSIWLARTRLKRREWIIAASLGAALAAVALHSLYKHLFAIDTSEAFVALGLAERTVWELLLLGAAAALWRIGQLRASAAMVGAVAVHFALYTWLLHNPLWSEQAVGPLPLLNLVTAAYAVPVAILWAVERIPLIRTRLPDRALAVAWMVLILLIAASILRQLFHGSLLVSPGLSQMEDIARSILAIGLAIGFLLWGIRTQQRDWRIGSLVLMLFAVAKVFLWDTSGLEGLIRIASFIALGFSLIGIGWLYSRQLAPSRA